MNRPLENLTIFPHASIREAMSCIDRNKKGIVLVVDEKNRLLGTVTDGDIRRAILHGTNLDTTIKNLLDRRARSRYPEPITAPAGTDPEDLLSLMRQHRIRQIPLLDEDGVVVDLAVLDDLLPETELPLQALIMAGGYGKRLRPLTEDLPKPMLPVGDRPLLERTIERLRRAGIRRVQVSTHYLKDKIADYFGDGEAFGVELNYVTEDQPLGTAGALGLMDVSDEPILVMNGDILTRVDFRALLDFHTEHRADMTIAVRQYEINVPYGVVETDGVRVKRITEKPQIRNFISAGIYLLSPAAHRLIPGDRRTDMPDLINRLLDEERTVICFPIREYWADIGEIKDYRRAMADVENGLFADLQGISA
jgi:dTDP-glucose pyrophosphorylase